MPLFDIQCTNPDCRAVREVFVHRADSPLLPCIACAYPVEKLLAGRTFHAHSDSVPGGFVIENLDTTPRRFDSKSAYRDELKARGLVRLDNWKGSPGEGSDKPANGQSRWY